MMTSKRAANSEMILNDDSLVEHEKNNETSLVIEIIGEILINRSLTIEQINEGFNIKNAAKIITNLLNDNCIEIVPESNPETYQLKRDINDCFMTDEFVSK